MSAGTLINVDQGSADWLTMRCGKVTASRVADVIAKAKRAGTPELACRRSYRLELAYERLTGSTADRYVSPAMERGTELEPLARAAYELATGNEVERVGMFSHPVIEMAAASPDGLIGDAGIVEFKCPLPITHIEYLIAGVVPEQYIPQIMWQLDCTGRQWADFASYCPDFERCKRDLFIKRIERDDELIKSMRAEVITFLAEVDRLVEELRGGKTVLEQQLEKSLQH